MHSAAPSRAGTTTSCSATTPTPTWWVTPGVLPAVIKAVETVDSAWAGCSPRADKAGARVLITADHGNCEMMIDPATGGVHTAHTTNPVPLVAVGTNDRRSGPAAPCATWRPRSWVCSGWSAR